MMYVPMVSSEAMHAAASLLSRDWGEYGYTLGIETAGAGGGIFLCRHFDGSEFRIFADRYGNARLYEPNAEYLAAV
jgi:hypothetical protein